MIRRSLTLDPQVNSQIQKFRGVILRLENKEIHYTEMVNMLLELGLRRLIVDNFIKNDYSILKKHLYKFKIQTDVITIEDFETWVTNEFPKIIQQLDTKETPLVLAQQSSDSVKSE